MDLIVNILKSVSFVYIRNNHHRPAIPPDRKSVV